MLAASLEFLLTFFLVHRLINLSSTCPEIASLPYRFKNLFPSFLSSDRANRVPGTGSEMTRNNPGKILEMFRVTRQPRQMGSPVTLHFLVPRFLYPDYPGCKRGDIDMSHPANFIHSL
jgi:hypothetical protein